MDRETGQQFVGQGRTNDGPKQFVGEGLAKSVNDFQRAPQTDRRIGMDVFFTPPQACKQDGTLDYYPAKITKVNPRSAEFGNVETVELVTFGPNSIYFQHNVPHHHELKPGHWSWR